jgi:hypothetical protein
MDARQFEALSRRVAHLVGRRSLLHAALIAPLVTGSAFVDSGDAKRKKRKPCKPPRISAARSASRHKRDAQMTIARRFVVRCTSATPANAPMGRRQLATRAPCRATRLVKIARVVTTACVLARQMTRPAAEVARARRASASLIAPLAVPPHKMPAWRSLSPAPTARHHKRPASLMEPGIRSAVTPHARTSPLMPHAWHCLAQAHSSCLVRFAA